ncbi:unnamed protein product [Gongylonema pulchrum]|uniref:Transmembrane protein n=1 Tax=Gongylonema pulchrum TaxID=637853 RepID=A0A183D3R0_9BILA|nr:unnamed protein product [Gongylonema pulchrum]
MIPTRKSTIRATCGDAHTHGVRQQQLETNTSRQVNGCLDKHCCAMHLSTAYFTTLTIQFIVITQAIIFLLVNYLRGLEEYSVANPDLKGILRFNCLLPLVIVQVSWLLSAVGSIYSVQRIAPYLMLPHLFTSLVVLFAAIALVALTIYHLSKGMSKCLRNLSSRKNDSDLLTKS